MQIYTVYLKRNGLSPDFVLVKEGFCWPGFFFSALWALWRRLWIVALALFAANIIVSLMSVMLGLNPLAQGVASLGLAMGIGFIANDLRRWTLERCGYVIEGVASGKNSDAAERRFLDAAPELAAELALETGP